MSSIKPFNTYFALIDCNNFFVSCERIFDPQLHNRPVVVLSSNDGCIISRSEEAKKLNIPMGAPHFKWKDFFHTHGVIVKSSNFALYADISNRVMETLFQCHSDIEIYSIDEAFICLGQEKPVEAFFHKLRSQVLQWVGIPISIGISGTKTLAKAAAKIAKRTQNNVFMINSLEERDRVLSKMSVGDIWGIGRRLTSFLHKKSILSAMDLIRKDDIWIRKNLSVTGLKTVWELRGISCVSNEEPTSKQSIMTSRSFGTPIESQEILLSALSHFAKKGALKLRQEKSKASSIHLFIMTSPHKEDFVHDYVHITFPEPTNYTPDFLKAVERGLHTIFKPGCFYKRGGVLLGGLTPEDESQRDLFSTISRETWKKRDEIMDVMDGINQKFGKEMMFFGRSSQDNCAWKSRSNLLSPSYTTQWDEILSIL